MIRRHQHLHPGVVASAAAVLALALAAPASAEERVESFKTTLVESSVPLGETAATGIVQGEPVGESFTIETREGPIDNVEVSPSTTYRRARSVLGEEANLPTLSDVRSGDLVGLAGAISGATVSATAVVISAPQAGAHPDLLTSFTLESPGAPEAAQNVFFNAPTGLFGNPDAITKCAPADFALDQCPPNSQAGLITIRANYQGEPNKLLGTAPIFLIVPQEGETARFSFVVPILDIPITIPVTVRTNSDYGLSFTVKDITQLAPRPPPSSPFGDSRLKKATIPNGSPKANRQSRPAVPKKKGPPASRTQPVPASLLSL